MYFIGEVKRPPPPAQAKDTSPAGYRNDNAPPPPRRRPKPRSTAPTASTSTAAPDEHAHDRARRRTTADVASDSTSSEKTFERRQHARYSPAAALRRQQNDLPRLARRPTPPNAILSLSSSAWLTCDGVHIDPGSGQAHHSSASFPTSRPTASRSRTRSWSGSLTHHRLLARRAQDAHLHGPRHHPSPTPDRASPSTSQQPPAPHQPHQRDPQPHVSRSPATTPSSSRSTTNPTRYQPDGELSLILTAD